MNDPLSIRRLYGRRTGHKLRQGQAELVERLLPENRSVRRGYCRCHDLVWR